MSPTTKQYIIGTIVGSVALGGTHQFTGVFAFVWIAVVMTMGAAVSCAVSHD